MEKTGEHEDVGAPVHRSAGGEVRPRSSISDMVLAVAMVGGFLLVAFSLLQPHSVFPDAWFPSESAAWAFKVVFCAWVFCEIVNNFKSRRNSTSKGKDRGSYWIIIGGTWSAIFVIFVSRSLGDGTFGGTLQYIGPFLVAAGIALRQWAIWVLGKHFTVRVQVQERTKLVTEGPYSYIRHPAYTGTLLTFSGLSLAVGSWLGILFVLSVCLAAHEYRIRVEEKTLLEAFGEEYKEYMKRTWKLFPGF
jgi:protein-S-isoprenylcysteine O-methyltransferase Ste14